MVLVPVRDGTEEMKEVKTFQLGPGVRLGGSVDKASPCRAETQVKSWSRREFFSLN